MQKIKDNLVKKIYQFNLSKICLVTLLDLINIADEQGKVQIYYKDFVKLVDCSEAQFYNVLKTLEDINIIKRNRNNEYKNEIDIIILENDFLSQGYCNYIDTNILFFFICLYKTMKAGEIRVYIYFLFRIYKQKYNINNDRNKLFYNGSYEKIAKQLGLTVRMTKRYCRALESAGFICVAKKVDIKNKNYDVITINKKYIQRPVINVYEKGEQKEVVPDPLHQNWYHFIKNICRRNKIDYDTDNLNNTAVLFKQYYGKIKKIGKNIYIMIEDSIKKINNNILNSRTIHHVLRILMGLDYADIIIAY